MNFVITVLTSFALALTSYRRVELYTMLSLILILGTSFYTGVVDVRN